MSLQRKIVFYFNTLVIPLVMMNLLIAVISDTYSVFSTNAVVYNTRELIKLIIDYENLFCLEWSEYDTRLLK